MTYWLVPVIPVEPETPEFDAALKSAAADLVDQVANDPVLRAAVILAAETLRESAE